MNACPCGSGLALEACCGPYLHEGKTVPTPEALMRSRYTAHTLGMYDYLDETTHPDTREDVSTEEMRAWSEAVQWEGLEVLETRGGHEGDVTGEVSFVARYMLGGVPQELREDSFFRREGDRWYYVDGMVHGSEPYRREQPKVGRNEPCPCGSGRKYKKCCGK
ncbi:YchJ family protein [Nitratidesulfovibrio vulgaris]|jgi:SEC-C motif-containing protein|uniref:SEC-C motif domain protein n=2 Tax=Nitratidesulfovibrio vulgaris TaxID=881 RepID=Q72FH1_NITV2|nr:YchJ family protein [Nitratidesulfovibrio vulgaris]GEB81483.1 hypothetical protein DDE01_28980 [Desulfovibrio desulfuricans]HBW17186.1 hypothetical protein [Desulfovibrio sp.]AAS94726.1 SEC-C motif domain protein [Nitratidesulfovibrio vulgaris str. Hildenborough]ABM29747.1 SEC-C motif domain protein [Nitratidesulfovibrio vulgaris DP4]ADP85385.1 SEC-C motif domain protein [Nitratidesulfovibrio vulgaris RCH1]